MKAEIISIGNEILQGEVLDSNSYFLAQQLTRHGVPVVRMHTILDLIPEITKFLEYTLVHDKADIVVTTGGLGPTPDDRTYEAVAEYLKVPLTEDPRCILYLQERVELLNELNKSKVRVLDEAKRKMALVPEGGVPLFNPAGAAPGLWYERDGQVLISLPGVPIEMKGIWEVGVRPRLVKFTEGFDYKVRHYVVHHSDESALAPLLADAMRQYPQVHFKTRPQRVESGWEMKLDVAEFTSPEKPSAFDDALAMILGSLEKCGIRFDRRED